jgi:hypothetical protein
MKKLLTTALAVMVTLSLSAQGTVDFKNLVAGGKKLQLEATSGAALTDLPLTGYQVALFWAPAGTTDNNAFQPLGAAANLNRAGYVSDGTRTIPSPFAGGGNASFLVKGWETAFGSSYDAVNATGNSTAHVGMSAIWTMKTGNPNASPPDTPPAIGSFGFNGLVVSPVAIPEPSTIALGLLGLAGLFVLRRRS